MCRGDICSLLGSCRKSCGTRPECFPELSQIRVRRALRLPGQGGGKEKSGLDCSAWKTEAEIRGGFSHQGGQFSSVASLRLILTFRDYLAEIVSEEGFCLRSWADVCHPLWEETPSQHGAWGGGGRGMLSISWLSRQPWLLLQDFLLLGQSGTEPPWQGCGSHGWCVVYCPRKCFCSP